MGPSAWYAAPGEWGVLLALYLRWIAMPPVAKRRAPKRSDG